MLPVAGLALLVAGCTTAPQADFAAIPTAGAPAFAGGRRVVPAATEEDLSALLAEELARTGVPALAAGVLRGEQRVASGVAGVRRAGIGVPVTRGDRFAIASAAKPISATTVARLVDLGILGWDRPVRDYFPEVSAAPGWEKITLRHLLTHTAGLRDPWGSFLATTYLQRGTAAQRRAQLVAAVMRRAPSTPPGTRVHYCNADYIVAGAVAERATGEIWEALVHRHVFAPLGMASAGFGPPGTPGTLDQPWGHGAPRLAQLPLVGTLGFDPGSRGADYPALASPAGYVHLDLEDWAEFIALHLRGHPANPQRSPRLLTPTAFDVLQESLAPGTSGGWFVAERAWARGKRPGDRGRVLFHLGDNGRWTSAVWLAPEIDFAVFAVCNVGNRDPAIDRVIATLVGRYAKAAASAGTSSPLAP